MMYSKEEIAAAARQKAGRAAIHGTDPAALTGLDH